jgi:hypothetical protein
MYNVNIFQTQNDDHEVNNVELDNMDEVVNDGMNYVEEIVNKI